MKLKLLLSILTAFLFCSAFAQNYNNRVTVYRDCYYKGQAQSFEEGSYRVNQLGVGNDAISSIYIPRGWVITVYENDNFQGQSQSYTGNIDCLPSNWNDRISSIRVSRNGGGRISAPVDYANNDQVVVYKDCNYSGSNQAFGEGDFLDSQLGVGNDKISSIRIPRGWIVTVFEDNNFQGASQVFTRSVDCLVPNWNDRISSIRISRIENYYSNNPVTVFKDCNYRSESQTFGEGWYRAYQLGVGNDKISSLKIPYGWTVTVYEDDNYRGRSITFNNNIDCLPPEWNDKISSMHVMRNR